MASIDLSSSQAEWRWSWGSDAIRPEVVAAGRARLAAGDWPRPIEVADALLAARPGLFSHIR